METSTIMVSVEVQFEGRFADRLGMEGERDGGVGDDPVGGGRAYKSQAQTIKVPIVCKDEKETFSHVEAPACLLHGNGPGS